MSKTIAINLTPTQIDYLRGVIYEYYNTHNASYLDKSEPLLHAQLEVILAAAENAAYA
jgi:hypothetical protein